MSVAIVIGVVMRTLAIIVALVFAPQLRAEWPYDAVCAISVPLSNGDIAGGSGTLVGVDGHGNGVVLSAAHVFEGGSKNRITCRFPAAGDKPIPAKLLQTGRNDTAVLELPVPEGIESPRSVRAATKDDGPFTAVGFPSYSRHKLAFSTGEFIRCNGGELETTAHSDSGMSGGAIFNRFGDYVGTISGNRGSGRPPHVHWDRLWGAGGASLLSVAGRWVEVTK